jgi:hypothetical protein
MVKNAFPLKYLDDKHVNKTLPGVGQKNLASADFRNIEKKTGPGLHSSLVISLFPAPRFVSFSLRSIFILFSTRLPAWQTPDSPITELQKIHSRINQSGALRCPM